MAYKAMYKSELARAHNMSTYPSDYAAFQAQKDTPGGKTTFKAYLWKVLGEVYDENQG